MITLLLAHYNGTRDIKVHNAFKQCIFTLKLIHFIYKTNFYVKTLRFESTAYNHSDWLLDCLVWFWWVDSWLGLTLIGQTNWKDQMLCYHLNILLLSIGAGHSIWAHSNQLNFTYNVHKARYKLTQQLLNHLYITLSDLLNGLYNHSYRTILGTISTSFSGL